MKYRKKPIVIEAEQFLPGESDCDENEAGEYVWSGCIVEDPNSSTAFSMYTLENTQKPFEVTSGDWIITGVKGERYPVKPDIFEMTYEKVIDPSE